MLYNKTMNKTNNKTLYCRVGNVVQAAACHPFFKCKCCLLSNCEIIKNK